MKNFCFLAKQGQGQQIANLLVARFGLIVAQVPYGGPRGLGVMVYANLPVKLSKRTVDRFLHACEVPGAVQRKNRFLVVKVKEWDNYKIEKKVGRQEFVKSEKGKLRKAKLQYVSFPCGPSCCGGYDRVVERGHYEYDWY